MGIIGSALLRRSRRSFNVCSLSTTIHSLIPVLQCEREKECVCVCVCIKIFIMEYDGT